MTAKIHTNGTIDGGFQVERVSLIMSGLQSGHCRLIGVKTADGDVTVMQTDTEAGNLIILPEDLKFMIDEGLIEWSPLQ